MCSICMTMRHLKFCYISISYKSSTGYMLKMLHTPHSFITPDDSVLHITVYPAFVLSVSFMSDLLNTSHIY